MTGLLEARLGKRPGLSSYDGAVLGVASKLDPSHLMSFYERSARRLLVDTRNINKSEEHILSRKTKYTKEIIDLLF